MDEDAAEQASTARQIAMGQRLRELRLGRDMSIGDLAERAGVSAGMISQIERGQANPSLKTLERIRTALAVSLWALLEATKPRSNGDPAFVRRAADRVRLTVDPSGFLKELLSPSLDQGLRFMIISIPPGGQNADVLVGVGEKAGLVLEGRITLTVGDETALLECGDSFQFDSNQPHRVLNPTDEPAQAIWIISMLPVPM